MKAAFFVVFLLAITTCDFPDDFMKYWECIMSSPTFRKLVPKVRQAIADKDYLTLLELALTELPKVETEVEECLDEPDLQLKCNLTEYTPCLTKCFSLRKRLDKKVCSRVCKTQFCSVRPPLKPVDPEKPKEPEEPKEPEPQ